MTALSMSLAAYLLILTALYDFVCALCMHSRGAAAHNRLVEGMADLHSGMLRRDDEEEEEAPPPLLERFWAYWIVTYGVVRLLAGLCPQSGALQIAAATTLWIEGLCLLYEAHAFGTIVPWKSCWTAALSLLLGGLVVAFAPRD